MALTYPADCDSPRRKIEFVYRMQELLRFVHNVFSYWANNDITQAQYDNPPLPQEVDDNAKDLVRAAFNKLKMKYPYKPRFTKADWDRFITEDFMPMSDKISTQINIQRRELKKSTAWSPDIGNM